MKFSRLIVLGAAMLTLSCCGPRIANDKTIGAPESETYQKLMDRLTEDLKAKFGGNMYQKEKISPVETQETVSIGIPNSTTYTFAKNDSKFIKGDLNNDQLSDLVICCDFKEAFGPDNMAYFVYLQKKDDYELVGEYRADNIAWTFANKMDFKRGIFTLDSISSGLMIGSTKYKKGNEAYFKDFAYKVETEKFKLNKQNQLELVTQSDLLELNPETGEYHKMAAAK
jgi:hypothetical protein